MKKVRKPIPPDEDEEAENRRGTLQKSLMNQPVDNDQILFESSGKPIRLTEHAALARMRQATQKGQFKNQLLRKIPASIDAKTQLLEKQGGHIGQYKSFLS